MKVEVVISGLIKDKVVEKEVVDEQLCLWLCFINDHGLFLEDRWIPTTRIKEIRYDHEVAKVNSRVWTELESEEQNETV